MQNRHLIHRPVKISMGVDSDTEVLESPRSVPLGKIIQELQYIFGSMLMHFQWVWNSSSRRDLNIKYEGQPTLDQMIKELQNKLTKTLERARKRAYRRKS